MLSELNKLGNEWNEIQDILLYGCGTVAELCRSVIEKSELNVLGIIDSDKKKQGKLWHDKVPVLSLEDALSQFPDIKIVVLTAHTAYNEIVEVLVSRGKVEYKDFCRGSQFICEWMWNVKGLNCLYHVDITTTTRCTLKCKNCNMFIPYYKKHEDFNLRDIKHEINLLFDRVDYISYIGLIGGENFLHPGLGSIVEYLSEKYADKYGSVMCATNGTVLPSEETLQLFSVHNVHIIISNYSGEIDYNGKLNQLCDALDRAQVDYEIRPVLIWTDYGFPPSRISRTNEEVKIHLDACKPEWNGLNDGRFYYCNCSWSAEKSGHFKLQSDDYIELSEIDPGDKEACRDIVRLSCGHSSFCKICGGCGRDNTNYVKVGEQIRG